MGLFVLGALRGLCGFCARVELGGYMTCGVFAYVFLLLSSAFLLLCLSSGALSLLLLGLSSRLVFPALSLCFLFPFRMYIQKERALRVGASSLVLLWVVCLLCKIGLSVLVKFVFVRLNIFGDTFIGASIFAIFLPVAEKCRYHIINKLPCIKMLF